MKSEIASTVRVMRRHSVQYHAIVQPRNNNIIAGETGPLQKCQYHLWNESPSSDLHYTLYSAQRPPGLSRIPVNIDNGFLTMGDLGYSHGLADKVGVKSKQSRANSTRMGCRHQSVFEISENYVSRSGLPGILERMEGD
ncbi:MAG: hypothetical protein QXU18_05905 [Thermoplasmatales archaeon]